MSENTETTARTLDPMQAAIVDSIRTLTEAANAKADEIGRMTTDRSKLVHDYLNPEGDTKPVDDTVAAFIEWRDKAFAAIEDNEAKVREHITATYLGEVDESKVDEIKAAYKAEADKVKAARKYYVDVLDGTSEDDLADVPALKSLRGGTSGGGSGAKRPRLVRVAYRASTTEPWTEVSKASKNAKGEDVTVTTFSLLASALKEAYGSKVEVKDIQAEAFAAAGTDDLNTLGGKVFEFAISVGEKTVFVQAQPRSDSDSSE